MAARKLTQPPLWFRIARILTIAAIVVLIAAFLVNLWLYSNTSAQVEQDWTPNITWTPDATRASLDELGWSLASVVGFFFWLNLVAVAFVNISVGLIVLFFRSRSGIGLYVAFTLVLTGATAIAAEPLVRAFPALSGIYNFLGAISWQLGFILLYIFPDGRFVPRWTRWLLLGWLGISIFSAFVSMLNAFVFVITLGLVTSAIASQVYRYFRHSDAVARQQTKWIAYSMILFVIMLPIAVAPFAFPNLLAGHGATGLFWTLLIRTSSILLINVFPLAIAIAILRYRLWDIDIIIRKTLTYAIVVALLLIVYFGSVVLLQQIFANVTGQRSEVVTVISTLVIAALFVPLRNRIQNSIDKRFYRKKYDAQHVLQKFAVTVRDETDLDRLSGELLNVVNETMQPKNVSVWLKADGRQQTTDNSRRMTEKMS